MFRHNEDWSHLYGRGDDVPSVSCVMKRYESEMQAVVMRHSVEGGRHLKAWLLKEESMMGFCVAVYPR